MQKTPCRPVFLADRSLELVLGLVFLADRSSLINLINGICNLILGVARLSGSRLVKIGFSRNLA